MTHEPADYIELQALSPMPPVRRSAK